jgi:hypothetical protein
VGRSLTDLIVAELPVEERHSDVFAGKSQVRDHLLVSSTLGETLPRRRFDAIHLNAEFVDQASDHDPHVARFALIEPQPGAVSNVSS